MVVVGALHRKQEKIRHFTGMLAATLGTAGSFQ
jgi:hypothetical protein